MLRTKVETLEPGKTLKKLYEYICINMIRMRYRKRQTEACMKGKDIVNEHIMYVYVCMDGQNDDGK